MLFQKRTLISFQIFMLLFFVINVTYTQNLKPFRLLRTIKTDHFDIIFPEESALTAYTLSGFAEEVYQEINALLKIDLYKRIPVVITPDTDQFNGYMSSVPSPRIVLFDTPMDLEWTSYDNALRSLFYHELTHAFSLSSRTPFFETMYRIFGGWMSPTLLYSSLFMVEGATVSFESLSGFGRANDPLIKQEIRQAIYEEKTLTPFQLSGVYDLSPRQASYYEYGGLFSAYLQQTYGMEKYAEFWQGMGGSLPFSFNVYNSGLYQLFNQVYGTPFLSAWNDFLRTISLDNIIENTNSISFNSKKTGINVLASSDDEIYFGDQLNQELLRYNPRTKKVEKFMGMDSSVFDIAVSSDGEHILLSSYRYKDALATAVVTEYDTLNGRASGRKWEHLARGQYFRDGVLGIASNLHNTNIVYRNAAGNEEVLLRGNEELIYTTPYSINETWIVYVRAVKGRRELCMFNYETKKEYVLKSNLEDDVLRWKYIRNLRVSGDKIFFVYNHDDRMYKLGVIDISAFQNENSAMNVIFTSTDFSGGIFLPALLDETIYYRGFFSEQDKLMQFPETINMISGIKAEINLVLSDKNNPEIFSSEKNNIADENTSVSKPYIGLAYMNPFNYWIPFLPLIRTTESFVSLDGWGLMSIMTDPTDTNMITLSAIGDWKAKMADIAIDWNSYYLGFPVTFSFSDGVDSMLAGNSYRQTRASLSGVYSRSIGNERNYVSIVPGIDFAAYANNPFNNSSAYTWSYADTIFSGALGVGWSNMYRYAWQLFGTGMSVNVYYRTPFDFTQTRIDSTINIAMEKIFPLRFQFYGAWDTRGMNLQGSSGAYASYFSAFASNEYSSPNGLNAEWLAGGQAELKLFGIEIQKNLSHIYFNRVYTSLAYRGVVYDGQGIVDAEGNHLYEDLLLAQSLVLRLGLEFSLIPIKSAPLKFIPNVWGAWKISNMNDGKENDFYVNFGFELAL